MNQFKENEEFLDELITELMSELYDANLLLVTAINTEEFEAAASHRDFIKKVILNASLIIEALIETDAMGAIEEENETIFKYITENYTKIKNTINEE